MKMNPTLRAILLAASLCAATGLATARSSNMVELVRQSNQITYKSSANMNYEHSDKSTSIHPKYNKWVEELNASIHHAAADAQAHVN